MDKDNSQDARERNAGHDEADAEREGERAPGDVLGLSRIAPDAGVPGQEKLGRDAEQGQDANAAPSSSERDQAGSRDLTGGTPGGTGPDTGGSGVFRRGSGATGTDIGR